MGNVFFVKFDCKEGGFLGLKFPLVVFCQRSCVLLHGGKGLPEVARMYGGCKGCVGAYHVVGGSVNGSLAAACGAVYVSYAAL